MSTLKAGWGYWDIDGYPYGGCFRRAAVDTPITITGPGAKANELSFVFDNGKNGIADKRVIDA